MQKLKITHFTREGAPGSFAHYFSRILEDGTELCLEACMGGYCVALYDKKGGNLIGEKTCTDFDDMMETQIATGFSMRSGDALQKAVEIANKKITGKRAKK